MRKSLHHIVAVNDRSDESYRVIFDKIEDMQVSVLRHAVNLGKGLQNNELILGSRDFDQDHVLWKSMFGNKMTRNMLSFFCDVKESDSHTGLRGLSIENAMRFMNVNSERFDFETNMLIETKKFDHPIIEETIKKHLSGRKQRHTFQSNQRFLTDL